MKREIKTTSAPAAIGPYSQGAASAGFVFVSGQLPLDPATGAMPEGIAAQTRQSLENGLAVLRATGLSQRDVVKTTVFLQNMGDFAAMNEVYAAFFEAPFPARACVEVARLPREALVEIEMIAHIG